MKRTIADARRALEEDFASRMNDHSMRQARAVLEAAEAEARKYADDFLDTIEPDIREAVDSASGELTEVRDALEDLRTSASDGRISASEYAQRLSELRDRQTAAEIDLAQSEDRIAEIEKIETDKLSWYDEQSERFAHLKRGFPW